MTKELESEVSKMCNLSDGIEKRGIEAGIKTGIKAGILGSVRNLMESMGWTAEQAMKALKIPEAEQRVYAEELKK